MPEALTFRRMPLPPLIGLLLIALTLVGAVYLARYQERANAWVLHTLAVEVKIGEVRAAARTLESSSRGYLVTRRPDYAGDARAAAKRVAANVDTLARLTRDNPVQRDALAALRPLVARKAGLSLNTLAYVDAERGPAMAALMRAGHGRALMLEIDTLLDGMKAEEERLLAERQRAAQRTVTLFSFGQAAAMLLLAFVAVLTVRDARQRFRAAASARDEVAAANESLRGETAAREGAEAQLRQMQKMEAIGQLTGGIAHDFNNMLAIVIGGLDLAKRRAAAGDTARLMVSLDNAREGADRAAVLTQRLLAFSRRQPLAPVALDVNRLVAGMSEMLRRTLGEPIAIETVLAGGLWRGFADPGQLESAILNLAVNARDAMPEGGRLTIETANAHLDDEYARAYAEIAAGQYVLISVSDTGVGMPAEVIERAFDPFFTTKAVGKGTGLGLSQVFGFAKQSGGHAAIYSEPDRGTAVKLYLPRHLGGDEAALATQPAEAAPRGAAAEVVLVVEDEPQVRRFSVEALRELGYTALDAGSAAEALAVLGERPEVRLLFTDVVMPETDGRRLAEQARARRPDLRVLYTTGYARDAVVHNGVLDAGLAFLPKPFTIDQLARKVREALDGA